jgi:hypothetical protein
MRVAASQVRALTSPEELLASFAISVGTIDWLAVGSLASSQQAGVEGANGDDRICA